MADMQPTTEQWKPVVGYEGLYEVSDHGNVRSLGRTVTKKNGQIYRRRGGPLKPRSGQKYASVVLYDAEGATWTVRVHRLVILAFVGPIPDGMLVRHYDDNPRNNHLSNLAIGTHSENMRDAVRNGIHPESRRTHCNHGHEFTEQNTITRAGGARACRECAKAAQRRAYRKKRLRATEGVVVPPRDGGTCHAGHPFDEENTYFYPAGNRECKACRRERDRARRRR